MALPKLDTPTYRLTIPSTREEIQYRPFLVKEQKLLMIAQESEDEKEILDSVSKVIRACTFDKIDITTSPLFDIEYVFLKLRSKSVGEKTTVRVLCPDDKKTYAQVEINLDEIEVQMTDSHTNIIELTDKIKLVMKYPQLKDMKNIGDIKGGEQAFSVLKHCVFEVHDSDKVYNRVDISDKDIEEFIDSLSTKQLELIMNFFETMPKVRHAVTVTNPKTKVKSEVIVEGIESFLA